MRGGSISNHAVVSNFAELDIMITTYLEYCAVSAFLCDYVITLEFKTRKHHCFANTAAFFF